MAMRGKSGRIAGPIGRGIGFLVGVPWLLALVWPMALIVLGVICWERYGVIRAAEAFVSISPDQVTLPPRPAIIRTDVTEAVFRETGLESVSLMDPAATAKIASAFSMNPWVEDVTSVRKLPGGGVDVRLQYRRVAAMVKVSKPGRSRGSSAVPHFFPVDRDGVMLPSQDFSAAQTMDYIHVDVPGVYSTSLEGTPFGEPRVEAAASLAWLLHPVRESLGIASIEVYGDNRRSITPQFEIITDDGQRIFWGSPPGREPAGESDAATKLRWLVSPERGDRTDLRWAGRPGSRR